MNVRGIIRLTFKQDRWNSHTDVIEYNSVGDYIGAWCDLLRDGVPIADENYTIIPPAAVHSIITYSGISPEMKVKGSKKKFTVTFYNDVDNTNKIPTPIGNWKFTVRNATNTADIDASSLINVNDITPIGELYYKQVEVEFLGGDEWISKNIKVWYESNTGIKAHVNINIVGL